MNYKKIFKIVFLLISSPAKAWEDISLQWDSQKAIIDFVYPMIGLSGLSVLIGSLIRRGWNTPKSFQLAMIDCCGVAIALFGGFFLISYLMNRYLAQWFNLPNNMSRAQLFTGYAMTVVFVIEIILGLFPDLQIVCYILSLYVFYMVYIGSPIVMNVELSQRLGFTVSTSLLVIVCPWLIQLVFNKLAFLLN